MDLPGEKLVIRLWETVAEKGIGSLLRPWQTRREARADAESRRAELLLLAQTEKDIEDIRQGRSFLDPKGQLRSLPSATGKALEAGGQDPSMLAQLASQVETRVFADAVRREVNVSKTLLLTEQALEADQQAPPEGKPSDDWIFRWRESVSEVSQPDLQRLWASVLAGEIKSPGNFSLRTLEFLRNLSQPEAALVEKLAPFVVNDVIYRGDEQLLESEGITYGFLLSMQELGLVTGAESTGLSITWRTSREDGFSLPLISHSKVLIATHLDPTKQVTLPVCQLSRVGRELLALGTFEPHVPYLKRLGRAIAAQGFDVVLADCIRIEGQRIRISNRQPVSADDEPGVAEASIEGDA